MGPVGPTSRSPPASSVQAALGAARPVCAAHFAVRHAARSGIFDKQFYDLQGRPPISLPARSCGSHSPRAVGGCLMAEARIERVAEALELIVEARLKRRPTQSELRHEAKSCSTRISQAGPAGANKRQIQSRLISRARQNLVSVAMRMRRYLSDARNFYQGGSKLWLSDERQSRWYAIRCRNRPSPRSASGNVSCTVASSCQTVASSWFSSR